MRHAPKSCNIMILPFCTSVLLNCLLSSSGICQPSDGALKRRFCPLIVRVENDHRAPMRGINVRYTAADSGASASGETITTDDGIAQFCGIDPGLYDIVVGRSACHQVLVKNVSIDSPQPLQLIVTYQACIDTFVTPAACSLFLRVMDSENRPVLNAIAIGGSGALDDTAFDEGGRLITGMKLSVRRSIMISAPGYESASLLLSCSRRGDLLRHDVILSKRQ